MYVFKCGDLLVIQTVHRWISWLCLAGSRDFPGISGRTHKQAEKQPQRIRVRYQETRCRPMTFRSRDDTSHGVKLLASQKSEIEVNCH